MTVSSNQSYSFIIGSETLGGFSLFTTPSSPTFIVSALTQLQKGSQYDLLVVCFNASDTVYPTSFQSIGIVSIVAAQSGAPQSLVLSPLPQYASLSASWTAPLDTGLGPGNYFEVLYYSLEFSQFPDFFQIDVIFKVSGGISFSTLQGLLKGKSYYCRIRAVTAAGTGSYSPNVGPQIVLGLPSEPTVASSTSGRDANGLHIMITWRLPLDTGDLSSSLVMVDQYQVQSSNISTFGTFVFSDIIVPDQSLSSQQQQQLISFDTTTSQSASLKALIQTLLGKFLYIRVRAHTVQGWGNFSTVQSQIVGSSPGAPQQVVLAVFRALTLNLSWSPPLDRGLGPGRAFALTSYAVRLTNSQYLQAYSTINPFLTSVLISDFQNSSLVRGEKYYADVQAVNTLGAGPFSASLQSSVVAVGLSQPPSPVILCPYNGGSSCAIGSSSFSDPAGALSLRCGLEKTEERVLVIIFSLSCIAKT